MTRIAPHDIVRISKKLHKEVHKVLQILSLIAKPIRIRFYHFLIKSALTSLRALLSVGRALAVAGRYIVIPLVAIFRTAFSYGLVPLYRVYRKIKGALLELIKKEQTLLAPLLHINLVVVVFALLAVLVITNNILIRDKSHEYIGKHSLLANVANTEGNEAEEVVLNVAPKTKSIFASLITPAQATALPSMSAAPQDDRITEVATTLAGIGGAETDTRSVVNYTVQGGDTVSTIAESFGVSTRTVLWANGMSEFDFIKPGQTLRIPPVSGVVHQVAGGDTLGTIARKYNVSENSILEFNKLADASLISIGDTLVVPGGAPPAPPAPPAPTPSSSGSSSYQPHTTTEQDDIPAPSGASGNYIWPTTSHRINQYFKYRHTGVDIDGEYSSPIYAAARGVVESVQYLRYGYGYHIIIRHPNGSKTLYGHASKIFVKEGQAVGQGQTIAMVGSTGRSTGTHLHFEVIVGGRKVNPLPYIR